GGRDLLIRSPRAYQVVQRRTLAEGELFVSGRLRVDADAVEVRFDGEARKGRLGDKWRPLLLDRPTKSFSGRFVLPAGGWYRARVRMMKGKKAIAEHAVEKFGIGEVFVGAGQSNSTNSGQMKTKQKSGMVSSFNGTAWRLADDPQWGPHDRSQGGSFWPAFGDAMYARFRVPIGVAATGHGGTSVNRWQPGGDLFPWMMTRIHQLGPGGFRALLWHQGESDVRMTSDLYFRKMKRIIDRSKAEAGWEFPWFVAQVSYHNPKSPRFDSTREAQERLWRTGLAEEGPDTDTLTGKMRDHDGKGIHFSPKGLKAHGEMWVDKVAPYIERRLGK
ncbi:MAG: sialate O-acetylesterase, partial [Planctomycetota bacterium]